MVGKKEKAESAAEVGEGGGRWKGGGVGGQEGLGRGQWAGGEQTGWDGPRGWERGPVQNSAKDRE